MARIPPKAFQVKVIKRILKQKGIDVDLIDVESRVDSTLTLSENARIISEDVALMQELDKGYRPETRSSRKIERFLKAVKIFEKRSNRQQRIDSMKQAKKTFEKSELTKKNFAKWKKRPNRYDIVGVDSKYS